MDLSIWEPHVRRVCQRHDLHPGKLIRPGLAGSFPTFIVADHWVVKFFGQLYGGAESYQAELAANWIIASAPKISAPALLATGELFTDSTAWHWPYLIFDYVPGDSIGEVYAQICWDDKLALAHQLGGITRQLHSLKIEDSPFAKSQSRGSYLEFLEVQRSICTSNHQKWNSLPQRLIAQISDYLLSPEEIIDPSLPPRLIHADITRDHILGQIQKGHWQTQALIDFGDAMIGDIFYELATLHLDVFQRDRRLLRPFLDSYGLSDQQKVDFPHKAMSVALLHQFNIFHDLQDWIFEVPESLEALATQLWDI